MPCSTAAPTCVGPLHAEKARGSRELWLGLDTLKHLNTFPPQHVPPSFKLLLCINIWSNASSYNSAPIFTLVISEAVIVSLCTRPLIVSHGRDFANKCGGGDFVEEKRTSGGGVVSELTFWRLLLCSVRPYKNKLLSASLFVCARYRRIWVCFLWLLVTTGQNQPNRSLE